MILLSDSVFSWVFRAGSLKLIMISTISNNLCASQRFGGNHKCVNPIFTIKPSGLLLFSGLLLDEMCLSCRRMLKTHHVSVSICFDFCFERFIFIRPFQIVRFQQCHTIDVPLIDWFRDKCYNLIFTIKSSGLLSGLLLDEMCLSCRRQLKTHHLSLYLRDLCLSLYLYLCL